MGVCPKWWMNETQAIGPKRHASMDDRLTEATTLYHRKKTRDIFALNEYEYDPYLRTGKPETT